MMRFLVSLIVLLTTCFSTARAEDWQVGQFVFSDWAGPPLRVFYLEPPAGALPEAPVVIVMHGVNRNADDYRDNWRDLAQRYGLRVYAPEFSAADFPGAALYNLGGVGRDGPSAYAALEPLFSAIARPGGEAQGYYLFGHSAGAQFVHRALLFEDLPHLNTAYSANAGWYTLPDASQAWPYGTGGTPASEDDIRRWVGMPLTILLGERDVDPRHQHLRHTPEAEAQGPHRYARGLNFANAARARADALGVTYGWRVGSVPGVAHDNAGMAEAAAWMIAADVRERAGEAE